jgi:hypothetical protein
MKAPIIILSCLFFLVSCGGTSSKQANETNDSTSISVQEEAVITDQFSTELNNDTKNIQVETEKKLQEVDSLLENF